VYTTPEDIKSRSLAGFWLFCLPRSAELLLGLARAKEAAAEYNAIGRHCCDRAALDCNRLRHPAFVRAKPPTPKFNFDRLVAHSRQK
jgi:hypothetical protein